MDIYRRKIWSPLAIQIRTKRHEPLLRRQRSEKSRWLHLQCRENPSPPLWAHRYLGVKIPDFSSFVKVKVFWSLLLTRIIGTLNPWNDDTIWDISEPCHMISCHVILSSWQTTESVMHPRTCVCQAWQSNVRLWLLVEKSGQSPQF